jgi:hypothetical protein
MLHSLSPHFVLVPHPHGRAMPKKAKNSKTTLSQSQSLAQAEHARLEGVIWGRPAHPSSREKDAGNDEHRMLNIYKPTPTPVTPTATLRERAIVGRYREFRDKLRKGPLYTVLNSNVRVGKSVPYSTLRKTGPSGSALKTDGFGSMPTYTHKYKKSARTVPDMSNMIWCMLRSDLVLFSTVLTNSHSQETHT